MAPKAHRFLVYAPAITTVKNRRAAKKPKPGTKPNLFEFIFKDPSGHKRFELDQKQNTCKHGETRAMGYLDTYELTKERQTIALAR